MKSKTAKQIIDNDALVMNNGDRMVDVATAYQALDLAKQHAIKAFKSVVIDVYGFTDQEASVGVDLLSEKLDELI